MINSTAVFAIMLASIIMIGAQIRRLQQRVKDLEGDQDKIRDFVGMNDDTMDSVVQLLKADQLDEAVQLIKLHQNKRPHLIF